GENGVNEVEALLQDADPSIQITALRALRQANPEKIIDYAKQLVEDSSPAVRREVVLALKDVPLEECSSLMLTLVDGYDSKDPWYLSALGISLEGKEDAFYPLLLKHFKSPEPEAWPAHLAAVVWELHPSSAVNAFQKRATSGTLSAQE